MAYADSTDVTAQELEVKKILWLTIEEAIKILTFDSDREILQKAEDLVKWMAKENCTHLYAVYGCSMGGSIALLTALQGQVAIEHCVMDGGITPYRLPWNMYPRS